MKTQEQLEDILKSDKTLTMLKGILDVHNKKHGQSFMSDDRIYCSIIGGAVIDILEGRNVKDYDLYDWKQNTIDFFLENGFTYDYESKTSITIKKGKLVLQFLKNKLENFDFIISQSRFSLVSESLTIDLLSFNEKILIPTSFDNKMNIINSLQRVPHWRKKGYSIPDLTYLSLVRNIDYSVNKKLKS